MTRFYANCGLSCTGFGFYFLIEFFSLDINMIITNLINLLELNLDFNPLYFSTALATVSVIGISNTETLSSSSDKAIQSEETTPKEMTEQLEISNSKIEIKKDTNYTAPQKELTDLPTNVPLPADKPGDFPEPANVPLPESTTEEELVIPDNASS
jgi:hypothetical protein